MADDVRHKPEQEQRIGKLRLTASARSSFSSGGGVRTPPVRVNGSYRYHKGSRSTPQAGGKMNAHLRYVAGQRKDQIDKATDKDRQLYNAQGDLIKLDEAEKTHAGAFIEHRIVISPKSATADDLHVLSQAAIQKIQSLNSSSEIRATYAVHTDTDHPHAHLLVTSQNKLELRKDDYHQIREQSKELLGELYRERGQEITQKQEQTQNQNQEKDQAEELGQER